MEADLGLGEDESLRAVRRRSRWLPTGRVRSGERAAAERGMAPLRLTVRTVGLWAASWGNKKEKGPAEREEQRWSLGLKNQNQREGDEERRWVREKKRGGYGVERKKKFKPGREGRLG